MALEQIIVDKSFVPSLEIILQLTGSTDMQLSLLQKMTNQSKISFNCEEVLGFVQCLSKDSNVFVNNVNACTKLIEQVFLKIDKDAGAQEKVQAVIALKKFYEAIQEKLPNNSNSNNYKMITEGKWRGIAVQLDICIADVETLIYREKLAKTFWTFLQYLKDEILLQKQLTPPPLTREALILLFVQNIGVVMYVLLTFRSPNSFESFSDWFIYIQTELLKK